jgi:DNA-directed RNA polymerase beta subunit
VGFRRIWCCLYLARTLTIKSDAMHGREQVIHAILENKPMVLGLRIFKVVRELQSVCLDIYSSQITFSKRGIIDIAKL